MKKFIFLPVLIALLFLAFSSDAANPNDNVSGYIHYRVSITTSVPFGQSICPSVVAITDGNGNLVGGYIPFRPYINSYDFYEAGPVTGTRVAHVMVVPFGIDNVCIMAPPPLARYATYSNGQTYTFRMLYGIRPLPAIEPQQQKD